MIGQILFIKNRIVLWCVGLRRSFFIINLEQRRLIAFQGGDYVFILFTTDASVWVVFKIKSKACARSYCAR